MVDLINRKMSTKLFLFSQKKIYLETNQYLYSTHAIIDTP